MLIFSIHAFLKLNVMRIHTLTALVACLVILVSCDKKSDVNGACDNGYGEDFGGHYSANKFGGPYTGTIKKDFTYHNYTGGSPNKVQFFSGFNAKAICTNEHMQIDYEVWTKNIPQSVSMKIFGDAYWSAFSDEIILFNDVPTPEKGYSGSMKVGLKQAFSQGGGDVDVFVNVEFTSLGSFSLDSAYFVQHVEYMKAYTRYSRF
jgi:hypothetical protein